MGWLSDADWKRVRETVPVCCVDILPTRRVSSVGTEAFKIGLILRDAMEIAPRWCLVGGRLLRNESLSDAIRRQVRQTLGELVHLDLPADPQPTYVAQYSNNRRDDGPFDPRQHALGLTFMLQIEGEPVAVGEALRFQWFDAHALPEASQFGFGQDHVIRACLARNILNVTPFRTSSD